MASTTPFRRTAVALALVGALGLGAVAAERILPSTTAAPKAPAAAVAAAAVPTTTPPLPSFADLVAAQGPAVVQIRASREARRVAMGRDAPPQLPPELAPFFRGLPAPHGGPAPGPSGGVGSGFIVEAGGIVLTNAHVVADADEVTVTLTDRREFRAKVLGSDAATDVAVLKIDATGLPTVKLGDPARTRVGDWVVAIGTPYGLDNTVTSGIVSAKSRALPGDGVVPFIQTDAAVNPGNSGGPLFNLQGEVIGINSQIFSRTGGFQGVAFAIPIDVALNVAGQIRATGRVEHGRLGVTVQPVDQALAEHFGLAGPRGALVGSVQRGSPAARGGLEPGDVIVGYNGQAIERSTDLPPLVAATKPGTTAKLDVWRDGGSRTLEVAIGAREVPREAVGAAADTPDQGRLGVAVRPLSPQEKAAGDLAGGLVVEEVSGAARKAGVRPGDIIVRVGSTAVGTPEQLKEAIGKAGKRAALLVQREDAKVYIPVPLG